VQTINAAHAQRLASPGQSVINDVNSGKYGKGFTASMPDSMQKTRDVSNAAQNAGSVAKGIGEAKDRSNINRERNSALNSQKNVPGQYPPSKGNKGIESARAKTAANGQQSTSRSASQSSSNKGIEAARQKSSSNQTTTSTSKASSSANKGIASYQNKINGQSSSATKNSSSPTATASKGASSSAAKSSGSSSGSGKSGGGQSR
jgi:hypothetical protein